MRFHSFKNFIDKYYKCNIYSIQHLFLGAYIIFPMLFLSSCCNVSHKEAFTSIESVSIENAKKRSLEIVSLYKDLYTNLEKNTQENNQNEFYLSQNSIDEIETFLSNQGYPVINSDSRYPSYLENSDKIYEFWKLASVKKEAGGEIFSITESGGLLYSFFQYSGDKKYKTSVTVDWDQNHEPVVSQGEFIEIMDWELVNDTDFYYQIYPSDRIYDDYILIRLRPINRNLYDFTKKYLSPIGYQSNNMFLFHWTSEDYGNLSFNDLFDFFYKMKNNNFFNPQDYEVLQEPYYHTNIPSQLFEDTLLHYFDISIQEFRERSLYDIEKNAYPWQEVCCENVTYYPFIEPEVVSYQENENGTFTLKTNVRCNDYKTDRLFTHEVIIRPLENGNYQYIGNKITYRSEHELPPNYPRLPPQRILLEVE